jgi:hypothetical protein
MPVGAEDMEDATKVRAGREAADVRRVDRLILANLDPERSGRRERVADARARRRRRRPRNGSFG